jgi:coenzyme F420-0:L-glutamate ligase / coenzyme F420-1:gamma-L-glutamate ligase
MTCSAREDHRSPVRSFGAAVIKVPRLTPMSYTVIPVEGLPELTAHDDVAALITEFTALASGDILVISSKIISKAEGRLVKADDREQAITDETVRTVATRGKTRIVENTLGLVMAAAGVDSSNVPDGYVLLLPVDPDTSAREIKQSLEAKLGIPIGVVISDTAGRPWRQGQTDIAIGSAGIRVIDDLRGTTDMNGRVLEATMTAVADELAAAADLVKGKSAGTPVAIIRGMGHLLGEGTAKELLRLASEDMFRLGTEEAWREGFAAGLRAAEQNTANPQPQND